MRQSVKLSSHWTKVWMTAAVLQPRQRFDPQLHIWAPNTPIRTFLQSKTASPSQPVTMLAYRMTLDGEVCFEVLKDPFKGYLLAYGYPLRLLDGGISRLPPSNHVAGQVWHRPLLIYRRSHVTLRSMLRAQNLSNERGDVLSWYRGTVSSLNVLR